MELTAEEGAPTERAKLEATHGKACGSRLGKSCTDTVVLTPGLSRVALQITLSHPCTVSGPTS